MGGGSGFSKTFAPDIIKLNNMKDHNIVIDASVILYKAALGAKCIKVLTDSMNKPTLHISVILSKIMQFKKYNIGQIWCFDFHERGYVPPDKLLELDKRKTKRDNAKKKLDILIDKSDELFSSDDDEIQAKINKTEKECFTMNEDIVNDCKFILDCFDITWVTAYKGVEAEHVCATLTNENELGILFDSVYSTDSDALSYGAAKLVREVSSKGKKIIQLYDLKKIQDSNNIDMDDFLKIAVILGTDHCKKTPGIGPKTVLRKFRDVELTESQTYTLTIFKRIIDISLLKFSNTYGTFPIGSDKTKLNLLTDWLVDVRGFNKLRVSKYI